MKKNLFENKYGRFSENYREYIISDPRTPRPWFNYMWNPNYAGLISHTGGGFSFLETPRDNRLTRMRYNSLPWDRPGRYVILRDNHTKKYWSLSWAPTIDVKYKSYECRHGLGYTSMETEHEGIKGKITYFVPRDMNGEIWKVKLTNTGKSEKSLGIYAFTELMMGNALNDIVNQPNDKHFTDIHYDKKHHALVATRRYWVLNKKVSVEQPNLDWKHLLLFTSTLPVTGFDSSLDSFIGKWRSESNPVAIETGKMGNTEITAGDPVAALQSEINLAPGEEKEFAIIMMVNEKNEDDAFAGIDWKEIRNLAKCKKRFEELKDFWDDYLSHFSIQCPDDDVNVMLNVWNQYQAAVTFDMARNSGYYHGGLLFGTGIRDQFQDILGLVMVDPERVKARLLNALRFQFSDGSTLHNFFKLTDWGERTNHSDTPLWIPFGLIEYLNETGDYSILDEDVTFYDGGSANVYEHLKRAVDYAISATTERGIPKIMNGDWNDTLDKVGPRGKGETIWGGFFLAYIIKKSFELLKKKQDIETYARWHSIYDHLDKVINSAAWDGEWYIRAYKDNGEPLGSHKAEQGKIFINAQTWSVISGLAPKARGNKALHSVVKLLERDNGIQICWPSYTKVEEDVGLISRCVPGKKENGSIFNHASSWFVLASFLNGDTEKAYSVYKKMLPVNSSKRIDRYEIEPYVYAEYVTSPDHETEGQASHSWLTGTAVWMLRNGTDQIAGFKTSLDGILVDPSVPSEWKSFSAIRKFRGKTIKLSYKRAGAGDKPSKKINGKKVDSLFIDTVKFEQDEINVEITE